MTSRLKNLRQALQNVDAQRIDGLDSALRADGAKAIMTLEEAADFAGLAYGVLHRHVTSGRLRATKPNGSRVWRVTRHDLATFLLGNSN